MASIIKLGKGKQPPRAIDFTGLDGKRCRLRIGKVTYGEAQSFKRRIETLISRRRLNESPDLETSTWLAGVPDDVCERMARFNLCDKRLAAAIVPTLNVLIDDYLQRRRLELKKSSITRIEDSMRLLRLHLNAETPIDQVTPAMAYDWRSSLLNDGQSEASTRTATRNVKTLFNDAIDREILRRNPFAKLPSTSIAATKDRYITPEETARLIDAAPNWRWRTLIGLARYVGLRCSKETHSVTWADVNWERHTLTIRVTKTGKPRIAPIRPEMMQLLQEAQEMAGTGAETILDMPTNNLHRTMRGNLDKDGNAKNDGIIHKASVEPWSDLFQHLRRCCRTQLLNEGHPPHAVSRWLGHGLKVGDEHYTILTDDTFDRVTRLNDRAQQKAQQ